MCDAVQKNNLYSKPGFLTDDCHVPFVGKESRPTILLKSKKSGHPDQDFYFTGAADSHPPPNALYS
jgi:hypothetical protein